MVKNIIYLHGFLGNCEEGQPLLSRLQAERWLAPSLYETGPLDPSHSFSEWVDNCVAWWTAQGIHRPVVIGYSMGGRLALHLATRAPQSVAAIIAISAHPGLHDVAEITSRRRWETEWAQRFLTETWASVVQAWDQQQIFSTSQTPVRVTPLKKELVALSLSRWSPTSHLFSWAQLLNSACPVHQIVGQKDAKYLNLMQQLNPDSQRFSVVENAGHRVLVDQPESLAQIIKAYLTAHVREVAIEKDVS